MIYFFIILLFLMFKAAQVFSAYFLLEYFQIRYEWLILVFYVALSLFQLMFYLSQNTPKIEKGKGRMLLVRYSTLITYLMEIIIIATAAYYLFAFNNNDIIKLGYIVTVLILISSLFYTVHRSMFSRVLLRLKISIGKAGTLAVFFILLFSFGTPITYLILKLFLFQQEIVIMDAYLLIGSLGVNYIATMWQLLSKVKRGNITARYIKEINIDIATNQVRVNDDNEFGYIQTETKKLIERIIRKRESLTLFNNYLSDHIRQQLEEYPIELYGELKNATVASILYSVNTLETQLAPQNLIRITNRVIQIIGETAEEYDAYPQFWHNQAILVYGAPVYYDHQKINALESNTRLIDDIRNLAEEEKVQIPIHIGIFSGAVICGALRTKGKSLSEYSITGTAMEHALTLASTARKLNIGLLVGETTMENLKTKFYIVKTYNLKLSNESVITANQIKT